MGQCMPLPKGEYNRNHVAVVLLNYNSTDELRVSVPQLAAQRGVRLTLILVDNASSSDSLEEAKMWLKSWRPTAIVGSPEEVDHWVATHPGDARAHGCVYFILNDENRGYSAGNNVGIRLADMLGADAVLIANPDMRIEDTKYLESFSRYLDADEQNYVVASRILDLDGKDQNPLRETEFWEELLWPFYVLRRRLNATPYVLNIEGNQAVPVPKVSGCCLLVRMAFLKATGLFDEHVFLYSEEPIFAAKVHRSGGVLLYVPSVTATHAHVVSKKGNSSLRMRNFIRSRLYYLHKYRDYKYWKMCFLRCSYALLYFAHLCKNYFSKFFH